jgi:hypothetical protein
MKLKFLLRLLPQHRSLSHCSLSHTVLLDRSRTSTRRRCDVRTNVHEMGGGDNRVRQFRTLWADLLRILLRAANQNEVEACEVLLIVSLAAFMP